MIKDVIEAMGSLENGEILLKGTNKKIISREEGFPIFLDLLLKTLLSLMRNVLKLSVKSGLITLGLKTAASAANAAIQKKIIAKA